MQYSKLATLCAFALTGALMVTGAQAADTTINITATVTATPCSVKADPNVEIIFSLDASEVASPNIDSDTKKDASITISGCPATTKSVEATFSGPDIASDSSGFGMKGPDGSIATTGSIRLLNVSSSTLITNTDNKYTVTPVSGAAEFKLRAYIHSITGSVEPGVYTTPVEVTYAYN